MDMDRRKFLLGTTALAGVALLPAIPVAEPKAIAVKWAFKVAVTVEGVEVVEIPGGLAT